MVCREVRMVNEDEIRARVEAADRERNQARADAAAWIAAEVEKRSKLRAELAELEAAIAAAVAESASIMTLAELSAFTGVAASELVSTPEPGSGGRAVRQTRAKKVAPRKRRSIVPPASPDSVAISSDF